MKKSTRILIKILSGLAMATLLTAIIVPVLFKDKIRTSIEKAINESINAKVRFGNYRLGVFRNFPNITFSLDNFSIAGVDKFENDTLVDIRSLNLVFNLSSIFSKSGYEIRSVKIKDAVIKTIVLADGSENWDIIKESDEAVAEDESASALKILLRKVEMMNGRIIYTDRGYDFETLLEDVRFLLTGDMTASETNLKMLVDAGRLTFTMQGMKYLNRVETRAEIDLFANLDSMKFYLKENYLLLNDLRLNFAGVVSMPYDDIATDLTFRSENSSIKSLMSLIPAVYMNDFSGLSTSGDIGISGFARGVYSDADSTMPDIALDINVRNGQINYTSLPEKITNINLRSSLFYDGRIPDLSTLDVNDFHMELAGNKLDMTLMLKTPVSDPAFSGSINGKIDLAALKNAIPIDSMDFSGLLELSVRMAGRMSMLEKKQYDKFEAAGNLKVSKVHVATTGYPEIKVNEAGIEFSPGFASLDNSDINIGTRSDFCLTGKLENYLLYLLKNEVLKGSLNLRSKMLDLSEIMSALADEQEDGTDTTKLAIIKIPENIDFDFSALIDKFVYNKIKATALKGHLIIRDGVLSVRETGMDILGGGILLNADYDTRDIRKPVMKADLAISNLGIKDAFTSFNTVQKFAPAAKGIDGRFGVKLSYSSLLGRNFLPVIQTISGSGKLQSDEIKLIESASYNKIKEVLKLGENYSNTFKDINVSFNVRDGRIHVSPFNTKAGSLKLNISGDQGLDQTLNYVVKSEIPRSELGTQINSLIDGLSAQASAFGISFKPSDVIKVNVKVTGTFLKPVITPFFGDEPAGTATETTPSVRESIIRLVDEKADELKQEVKNELSDQADRLIQEAEEKARLIQAEAENAAEAIRNEADLQAQKLIEEAETKGTFAKIAARKSAESLKKEADRRATQLVREAGEKSARIIKEAKTRKEQLQNPTNP
ncbi:MAG TPA: AsmA-like C-terminal region-containing protein [Bacteroidales bacterium]|nr:AsmA-like C-terminal region-containing protein [Bacteroidales bacterium]